MKSVKITYLGHSCFVFEKDGFRLCIDPFCKVDGYKDVCVGVNEVICTHEHFDHAYKDGCLALLNLVENPFEIEKIPVCHDDKNGTLRGMTDIVLLKSEGIKIAHFGDIGEMLSDDVAKKLSDLDVALIPVGGTYTVDCFGAKAIIEKIKPKIVIPMHYRDGDRGFRNIAALSDFTALFDVVSDLQSDYLELPTDKNGIVVLTPRA